MKSKKIISFIFMISICILICLVGFVGIFTKKNASYQNKIPNYTLASDLKGATVLEFEVDTSTNTVYYDAEGNQVDEGTITDENKADYTSKEEPVNDDAALTKNNYKKVVKIMKERLQFLRADQYRLDLDETTGKIVLTFEDEYPDDIQSFLPMTGALEIKDSNTKDIILDASNLKSVEATYASVEEGYNIYLNLKLNQSGIEKINAIDQYKTTTNSETNEKTVNTFKITFDGEEIAEVSYDDMLLTGKILRVTTAEKLTNNTTIQSKMNTNTIVAKLATFGKMPVVYKLTASEYVKTEAGEILRYATIGLSIACLAIAIYFVMKYKINGVLATIGFVTNIAIFLIMIRLTNISISINGLVGIMILLLCNTALLKNILRNLMQKDKTFGENIKKGYLDTIDVLVMVLFIFAVFAFSKMTVISSMGLLIFWGWLTILLGNLTITVPVLALANKK